MLEHLILILAVLISTGVAYRLNPRVHRAPLQRSWPQALAEVMECIGLTITFLAVNVGLGVGVILAVRTLTPIFVSLYAMDDITLVALSVFQGIAFRLWWR